MCDAYTDTSGTSCGIFFGSPGCYGSFTGSLIPRRPTCKTVKEQYKPLTPNEITDMGGPKHILDILWTKVIQSGL